MNKILSVIAGFAVMLAANLCLAQEDEKEVVVTPIKGPLHMMQGQGEYPFRFSKPHQSGAQHAVLCKIESAMSDATDKLIDVP